MWCGVPWNKSTYLEIRETSELKKISYSVRWLENGSVARVRVRNHSAAVE